MNRRRLQGVAGAGLAAAALLLQGCATAPPPVYGPVGVDSPYGYRDHPNADGSYTVVVITSANATVPTLRAFFDRRAGELCPNGIDRTNVFRVHASEYYSSAPAVYGGAGFGTRGILGLELEGYVYCKPGPQGPAATLPVVSGDGG